MSSSLFLLTIIAFSICYETALSESSNGAHDRSNLPAFLIAGTQKSGTTVLAALLSDNPHIQFSRQKEVHFFDKGAKYRNGLDSYLQAFPALNSSQGTPLRGEATPFYIASRNACGRIAESIPTVKMIVLLREPVARAYSEYQMKRRRVASHEEFLALVRRYEKEVYECMVRNPKDFDAVMNCVPAEISEHSRMDNFVTAWRRAFESRKRWDTVVDICFPGHNRIVGADAWDENDLTYHYADFSYEVDGLSFNLRNGDHTNVSNAIKQIYPDIFERSPPFNASSCWSYYKTGMEKVKTLREAMMGEMTAFRRCRVTMQNRVDVSGIASEVNQRLERLDQAVDHCIKVQGGISTQYFYRSMYAVQLYHCFKSIPRGQFLIIPSGRLRREPSAVLSEVLRFLNVPQETTLRDEAAVGIDGGGVADGATAIASGDGVNVEEQQARIRTTVEKHFPRFASKTGWDFSSNYEPLPEYLSEYMHYFYVEQNQLLFHLLNESFEGSW